MADSDYEILPHKLLSDLKYDVEALKKKLTHPDAKAEELILEIESLKDYIHELTNIFERAIEETKAEDLSKNIKDKLDAVIRQNETIAKGMIAISDKVDDFIKENTPYKMEHKPSPMPVKHTMTNPSMPTRRMAPLPGPAPIMPQMEVPIPPSPLKKRQGLFG